MNKVQAVFYDLDNTLYPQIADIEQRVDYCVTKYAPENCRVALKSYWLQEWTDNGPKKTGIIDDIVNRFPLSGDTLEIIETYRSVQTSLHISPDIQDILKRIDDLGILQFLITNGHKSVQKQKIASLGIADFFEDIRIAEGEYAKPSPAHFNELIQKYDLEPVHCMSVGDWYTVDGISAIRSGIPFVYLRGGPITEIIPPQIRIINTLLELWDIITI